MELIKKILPYAVIIIPGVFLEYWIYTFSHLLSIKDFLFDQNLAWIRFLIFMLIGNIFLVSFCFAVVKRIEKLVKIKINLLVAVITIWIASFMTTILFYSR